MWMLLLLLLLFIDEPIATDPPASMTYRASFRMDAIRHSNVRRLWRFVWWWKTTTSWGQKGPYRSTNHDRVQASQLSASVWASYKTDASRFLSLNKKKNKKEEKIAKTTLEGRRKRGKFFFSIGWLAGTGGVWKEADADALGSDDDGVDQLARQLAAALDADVLRGPHRRRRRWGTDIQKKDLRGSPLPSSCYLVLLGFT